MPPAVAGRRRTGTQVTAEPQRCSPADLHWRVHSALSRAVTTAGEYLVPQLIQAFRERRPDLEISLDVGNRELVFQRLLDHNVDVAVTGARHYREHGPNGHILPNSRMGALERT